MLGYSNFRDERILGYVDQPGNEDDMKKVILEVNTETQNMVEHSARMNKSAKSLSELSSVLKDLIRVFKVSEKSDV